MSANAAGSAAPRSIVIFSKGTSPGRLIAKADARMRTQPAAMSHLVMHEILYQHAAPTTALLIRNGAASVARPPAASPRFRVRACPGPTSPSPSTDMVPPPSAPAASAIGRSECCCASASARGPPSPAAALAYPPPQDDSLR